jgi:hypothetical protein
VGEIIDVKDLPFKTGCRFCGCSSTDTWGYFDCGFNYVRMWAGTDKIVVREKCKNYFYIENPCGEIVLSAPQFPLDVFKPKEQHLCTCDRDSVFNFGCRCGGI